MAISVDILPDNATADDISRLFELFLGRAPEPATVDLGCRRPLGHVLEEVLRSDEFANVREAVLRAAPLPKDRFQLTPRAALQQWATDALPLSDLTRLTLESPLSARETLRRVLSDPAFHHAVHGDLHLSRRVRETPVDGDDVAQGFRLFLGRSIGSDPSGEVQIADHIGSRFSDFYAALISSEDFQATVLARAVGGSAETDEPLISMSAILWARRRFCVDASIYDTRFSLIAAILETDFVAATLADPDLGIAWPPKVVAARLRAREKARPEQQPNTATTSLPDILRGLQVIDVRDLIEDGSHWCMTSGDPAITFLLDDEIGKAAPAVELTFAVAGGRRRAQGMLYVDYGDGFSEKSQIELRPAGRTLYSAMLLKPANIRALRWDPDDFPGDISFIFIGARPVGQAEYQKALSHLPLRETTDLSAREEDLALSRLLTCHVYGHEVVNRESYADWIEAHEPGAEAGGIWAAELRALTIRPLISVLVPVYETPPDLLRAMIDSVTAQVYPHWELCLADDASKAPYVRQIIERYIAGDARIKAVFRERNGHISEASNSALELVTGDWLALLDHDDVLRPHALLSVASEIQAHPDVEFIYSDEDKLDAEGRRYQPFFKPDYSPELLRSQNYLNHLSVHRTANVRAAGGWRKGFEGSQDYDLNLRTLEKIDPARVRHIPKVLYHWRAVEGSTALSNDEKGYAFTAGLRALEEHVARMGWSAVVEKVDRHPFYRVRYALPSPAPLVSLIIPTRDRADLLETCIRSIVDRTDYEPFEILIVDNGSSEPATFKLFEGLKKDRRVRIVDQPGPFNYSRINNAAVRESRGQIVGLVNNDIEVISPGWMTEMAAWASLPRIGCVGAKLYYPDDTIQHAGVVLGIGGVAGHSHKHHDRNDPGYFCRIVLSHDVSAVTGACLFVRREIYDVVNGLDEQLSVAFNDVDFCMRVAEAGYRNVFTPFAELYHHESVSRGAEDDPVKVDRFNKEVSFMKDRWGNKLKDPFYSPSLTQHREDYSLEF